MDKRSRQVEAEIDRRITATLAADSPNRIAAAELRDWAVEYLQEVDAEVADRPHLAGRAHWNLWMMDARYQDALFTVLIFDAAGIEFFCGTGDAFAIKRFDFIEDDLARLPAEMGQLFAVPAGVLHLSRATAKAWLGRSW
jgi:hypothetical protein